MNKIILDACCGSKMFWFDRNDPRVLFQDIREESHTLCDGRSLVIDPDVIADFRAMPYNTGSFRLVVFDPPHFTVTGDTSYMFKKYGRLSADWQNDIYKGFHECMRVLEDNGVLVFKWNETHISTKAIIECIGVTPLFGHISGKRQLTHWLCFIKDDNYLL